DAQALERRRQELRADLLGQHEPIRRHARLGEEADGVVQTRIQQRVPHLVHTLEAKAVAVNLLRGALAQRPGHVLVWAPQHRQRAHAAAEVALRRQLETDLDPARIHPASTKRAKRRPYSSHEYRTAAASAALSIAARSRARKNSSTASANAAASSEGKTMPARASTLSGSPPASLAITGRPKWNAVSATPLCSPMRYAAR